VSDEGAGVEPGDRAGGCGCGSGGACRGAARRDVVPLSALVRGEAVRSEAGERIQPDPVRLASGWVKRFAIERTRAADLARLYEEAGFEVALDPVSPERLDDECGDCRIVARFDHVLLYTRRPDAGAADAQELRPPTST
jgi:hypothetical protein